MNEDPESGRAHLHSDRKGGRVPEWRWPGIRGEAARVESRSNDRADDGRRIRTRDRLPRRGDRRGGLRLVPPWVLVSTVFPAAGLGVVVGALVLGAASIGSAVFVGLSLHVLDRWYLAGAHRLGLLSTERRPEEE